MVGKLAEMVAGSEGDFMQNLLAVLGRRAIPRSDIFYFSDRIGFEAKSRSEGHIVPLVLEVESKNF
jgi:hypothetical protein